MAKYRVPKKVAGFKVPKVIRKSPVLTALLGSATGRKILGDALMAGAAAAAAVLVQTQGDDMQAAGRKAARGGKRAGNVAARAVKDAAGAMVGVIGEAAQAVLPTSNGRSKSRNATH